MLQEILQKWKKKARRAPTDAAEIQLTPIGRLCFVISCGISAESTSVLGVQNKTGSKYFCLVDDLPFGNS